MEIRNATLDHVESILECLLSASDPTEDEDNEDGPICQKRMILDLVRASTVSNEESAAAVRVLVAVNITTAHQEVLGFIAFKRVNHLSLLFVRSDHQGQGIGRMLWNTGKLELVDSSSTTTTSTTITVHSSLGAIPFYHKLGFSIPSGGEAFCKRGRTLTLLVYILS
jgi:GNAT superfamily N-acetyltransferase